MTVNLTRIYTRLGDGGETHLGDMSRVPKTHPRIEAYGEIDELNAQIGVTLAVAGLPDAYAGWLRRVQNDLFDCGADLSVPEGGERERLRLKPEQVTWLEEACDEVNATLQPLKSFVLPGGTPAAAQLHVCRTVCRRAERRTLLVEGASPEVVRYLNRLSDLLFILSRGANDGDEPLWGTGPLPLMDDAAIVALLSGIEPSEGEIPKPPFMAAVPAGPVIERGADLDAVEAWVKARGGWTHRAPAHLDPDRPPLFFIVPKGHLQTGPAPPALAPAARAPAARTPAAPVGAPGPGPPAAPARGLAGAELMAFAATSDLAAARAFYERGLGLPMSGQSPIAITFDCGGTTLRVALVERPVIAPYTVLGFTVADMAATITDLAARGIDFERFDGVEQDELGVWSAPGGALVAWFKDPDGNTLSLTQF